MKLYKYINDIQNKIGNDFFEINKVDILNDIRNIIETNNYDNLLKIISDENFYEVLTSLYYDLLHEDISKTFLASLWYKKLISFSKELQSEFLNLILSKDVNTFIILACFEDFMSYKFDLSVEFFVNWFSKLGKFVENDYCAYLFYNGITPFSKSNKELAFKILQELLNKEYSEITYNLISIILGTLRTLNSKEIKELDKRLKNADNVNRQKYYYTSLVNTYCERDTDIEEIDKVLAEILSKNKNIESEAFFIAYRLFISSKKEDIKNFIIQWLLDNTNKNLTDLSKYYCVMFIQCAIDNEQYIDNANKILINIQPINNENKGTYETLSFVLTKILEKYPNKFNKLFSNLLIKNNLSELLNEEYFIDTFVGNIDKIFFTELFISKNVNQRYFSQEIYINNSDKINFENDILATINDKLFELICKEILLKINYGNIFAKFIIDFNDCINKVKNKKLRTFLDTEISHQCINFPQGCYETLKNYNPACDLIKNCLKKVENYFDIINKYKNCPINSFTFSSCNDAVEKGLIKQYKEIMEGIERNSTLMALVNKIELLYGDKHAHRTNIGISESETYTHLEHSIEIPILSFLNPISEIFKTVEINNEILNLRKEIGDAK
ncbi:hypothetical protein HDR58_05950 [bacterium]|nr:hypothetical protein [bacterium]